MNLKKIIYLIIILLLTSCSPQKRLNRLINKYPELSKTDTIKLIDSVIVPAIKTDTFFSSFALKDTITITKEKLKIKLVKINDTIYLNAEVEPDTIIFEREIPIKKVIYKKPISWWHKILKSGWFWLIVLIVAF